MLSPAASAELAEINVAQQYGIGYLPLMLMEEQKLIEKHAKAAGVDVKVGWAKFAGGNVMNDALLSNSLQFASGGVGPLVTLWSRTKGNLDVKAVSAINSMPLYLNTRNPNVKTIKDFTEKDRIALPAVKVSIQAVTLQMAAEKAFGEGQQGKLDALTVTMSHPDAQVALLSGASEITAHFSSPPFQYQQLEKPGIHTVLNSYDVLGGPATFNVVWTTSKFRNENPKLYDAFVKALDEATAIINRDKKAAAEAYLRISKDKDTRRRHPGDAERSGHRLHDDAAERDEVRRLHGQDRVDQGEARLVEGSVLPEHPRARRGADARRGGTAGRLALPDLAAIRAAHAQDRAARAPHAGAHLPRDRRAKRARGSSSSARISRRSARSRRAARPMPCSRSRTPRRGTACSRIRRAITAPRSPMRRGSAASPAWVVMPENSAKVKQENVRRFGAHDPLLRAERRRARGAVRRGAGGDRARR